MVRISRIALGVAALVTVALPAGALSAVAHDPVCLATTVLAEGPFSAYDPSPHCDSGTCPGLDVVIQDATDFAKWWDKLSDDPAPAVNFRAQIVVATFMGKRPNTSYTTNVGCVERSGLSTVGSVPLTVHVTDSNAGAGCIVQPAIVNPYEVVVFDRPTNGLGQPQRVTVTFDHTTQVYPCDQDDPICRVCNPNGGGIGDIEPNGIPCCP